MRRRAMVLAVAGLASLPVGCASRAAPVQAALRAAAVAGQADPGVDLGWGGDAVSGPATGTDAGARRRPQDQATTDERDKDPAKRPPSTDTWERRPEDQEVAVIRRQLGAANQQSWDDYRKRRTSITGFVSLNSVADQDATSGLARNFEWTDVVEDGIAAGIEVGHDVLPVFDVFVGGKYSRYGGDSSLVATIPTSVVTKTSTLRSFPFYLGGRINFPLAMSTDHWLSSDYAGLNYGIIPFVKGQFGGVFVDGNEVQVITATSGGTPFKYDFIRRGFYGYAGVEVGIEYRSKDGFGVRLSVGAERYFGLELDPEGQRALPGAKMTDLRHGLLPQLSASVYF